MVKVGIVGIGFMGLIHYLAYQKVAGAQVTAIVSRSEKKRMGDWRHIKGNFGPEGTVLDLGSISRYESLDQLLNNPEVDLVDICLPQALHTEATTKSLLAGKHVLCEKPISLHTEEADYMLETAMQAKKLLMIGQVLAFFPEYAFVRKSIDQGKYGSLKGGFFKRIISDPIWRKDYYDSDVTGGPLVDLHVHDAHFIRLLYGMPQQVYTRGRMRGTVADFAITNFIYNRENAPLVSAVCGVVNQQGRPFTQAFEIYLDRATILYDFANLGDTGHLSMPLTILTEDGKVEQPNLQATDPMDAFVSELNEVAQAVESGLPSTLLDGSLARDALLLCYRQTESIRSGNSVPV